ncbi:MAG: biopolymer transporter ExbD [Planctomycetales bacterium]|nr:biopolymer transporter ExbD [Planctomycetales bacterium]
MSSSTEEFYVDVIEEDFVSRRKMDEVEIDITPMIDITFLLLIFFIVASKLDEGATVDLPEAKHGTAVAMKSSAVVSIGLQGDKAAIYLGEGESPETQIKSSDPEDQEAEIMSYIESQIASGKTEVIIMAAKDVRHGDVARVSKAVGKAHTSKTLFVAIMEAQ